MQKRTNAKKPHLVLGTVQLGIPYGAANRTGLPDEADAVRLIQTAISQGIREFDTARAYGDSERRIGIALAKEPTPVTVMTKLTPLLAGPDDTEGAIIAAAESLSISRHELQTKHLEVLQLHRAVHRTQWNGAVWQFLRHEMEGGRIRRLGISVQSPAEALEVLKDPSVQHIQLPFNMLDHRWAASGVTDALRRRPDVTVHARSILLQGLLTDGPESNWPQIDGISPSIIKARLREIARSAGRRSVVDLAIAYARAQDWLDGIVIGVETQPQLAANIEFFERPPLSPDACDVIERLPRLSEKLLDPSSWHTNKLQNSNR